MNTGFFTSSRELRLSGFNFSGIPANATITGFTINLVRSAAATTAILDATITLSKNGVLGANRAGFFGFWPTSPTAIQFGGPTDLFGLGPWLLSDLNSSFAISVDIFQFASNSTATITSASVTVHYQILAPIILTNFDVSKTADNYVNIQFATSSEENVKNIFVERSSDARNFSTIFTITPQGARNRFTKYTLVDKTPLTGMNYYRLKEVDIDGNVSYFDIKGISISRAGARFQAFYSGGDIKVNLSSIKGNYQLSLYDAGGAQVSSQNLKIMSNSFQTSLPAPQRAGVYIVTLKGEGISETARIFVGK